ncbi:MAG: DUF4320 family protein [Hydrogenoanaerobacterium sp.]
MIEKLREKRGSIMIGVSVTILVFTMVLMIIITFVPLYNHKQALDTAATEIARYIEIKGAVNREVFNYVEEIKNTINLNFDFSVDANYTGSQNIQLEDKFTVTLTYDTKFGIGGIMSIPIRITGKGYGVSEKYRK